jgi:predicted transcriptional regulator
MNLLISIKPKYTKKIISGEKKFEYRKKLFKNDIQMIFIYSSSPEKKIIGYFKYAGYSFGIPADIWEETKHLSGITETEYKTYFLNKEIAFAIKINDLVVYKNPIDPYTLNNNFWPPQSFMYIKNGYKK